MDVVPDTLFDAPVEPVASVSAEPETEAEEFMRVCAFLASLRGPNIAWGVSQNVFVDPGDECD